MSDLRNSTIFQSFFVLVLVIFLIVPAQAQYSGGTGEPNNPYQIAMAEDLIALGNEPNDYNKHFILTADINLDPNLRGIAVFNKSVIGTFSGVFDGNFHKISNLNIQGTGNLGLFGTIDKGEVRNLGIINVNISSSQNAGGLAISNEGSILNCYLSGSIKGAMYIGGLVGENKRLGSIKLCYSTCNVIGTSTRAQVGGLVGHNDGEIFDSYSNGNAFGVTYAGGLVGSNESGLINRCYSIGQVTSDYYIFVGGLVGICTDINNISNSFWNIQTSGQTISSGGTGATTDQMQDPNTFIAEGWDFVGRPDGPHNLWAEPAGGGYPILWWQQSPLPEFSFSGGNGEPNNPYLISTAEELNNIGYNPRLMANHFKLTNNINLADIDFYPIGNSQFPYEGIFDGNSFKISNLSIKGDSDLGLFSVLEGGAIRNVSVIDVNIVGTGNYIGGLVGDIYYGTISQCYTTGSVKGYSDYVGGLAGTNGSSYTTSTISQSYSNASVNGNQSAGGLIGQNYDYGKLENCYSIGKVDGNDYIGGLIGCNYGTVIDSYSSSLVECYLQNSNVGGLIGKWSYIVDRGGIPPEAPSVFNSFWDIQASGQITSEGGIGKTTDELKMKSTFTDAGWDFVGETDNGIEDIWTICEGTNYPRFVWQIPEGDFVCPDGVAMEDFEFFMDHWLKTNCNLSNGYCDGTDLDFSGTVDINDFEILINNWLEDN